MVLKWFHWSVSEPKVNGRHWCAYARKDTNGVQMGFLRGFCRGLLRGRGFLVLRNALHDLKTESEDPRRPYKNPPPDLGNSGSDPEVDSKTPDGLSRAGYGLD